MIKWGFKPGAWLHSQCSGVVTGIPESPSSRLARPGIKEPKGVVVLGQSIGEQRGRCRQVDGCVPDQKVASCLPW